MEERYRYSGLEREEGTFRSGRWGRVDRALGRFQERGKGPEQRDGADHSVIHIFKLYLEACLKAQSPDVGLPTCLFL